jgi:hypothetical protein
MKRRSVSIFSWVLPALVLFAKDEATPPGGDGRRGAGKGKELPTDDVRALFKLDVPKQRADIILGRPTQRALTASVRLSIDGDGVIQYGAEPGGPIARTAVFPLKADQPMEVPITGLIPDSEYTYQLLVRTDGKGWGVEKEGRFRTQRPPGASFVFTVQADSHLDYNTEPALYLRCLGNAQADSPDFHIDLGDTFMTDKHRGRETAAAQYAAQRYYFSQIAHSAPLFLVLGNHDPKNVNGTASANGMRAENGRM